MAKSNFLKKMHFEKSKMNRVSIFLCINFYLSFTISTIFAQTSLPCNTIGPICAQNECFAYKKCKPNKVLVKSPCNNCCLDECVPKKPQCPNVHCDRCPKCACDEILIKNTKCNNCCLDYCVPNPECPKIKCKECPKCPENETLVENPCGNCCLDTCAPKPIDRPCPEIFCYVCPKCAENETLVKSHCNNCCLDKCVPKENHCPEIACKKCPTCAENETLVKSHCNNCCLDKCVPSENHCPEIACKKCPTCAENETLIKSLCNNCCLDRCIPTPPRCPKIGCEKCVECSKNETLIKSPCNNCCLDTCIPKGCPNPPINCLLCLTSCPKGEVLVRSPCGCCHNKCVPIYPEKCPDPPIKCIWCPICAEGYTLVKSPCGCCHDRCVRNKYCRCPLIRCPPEGVTVPGPKPCRCPTCVIPKPGDKCLKSSDGGITCGSSLACCDGICQEISKPCEVACPCYEPICDADAGEILIPGPEPCKCPICVTPEPGQTCYESFEGTLTCGNLNCCDGICQRESCDKCTRPCPRPYCTNTSIYLYGPEPCRCPYCVNPVLGGECYESPEVPPTCGEKLTNLTCCNGVCQDISKPCEVCSCPLIKCSNSAVIVPGPKPCRCPNCVVPKPGDKCLETFEGYLTCGADLICCDGVCKKSDCSCKVICNCPLPLCVIGSVQVPGKEPCRCPTCILPEPGDKCLVTADGSLTCGENLDCCDGICEKKKV